MSIEKTIVNDQIEMVRVPDGYPVIQVRTATIITDNGVEISRTFHRRVVTPGDNYQAEQDADVRAIIQAVFTEEALAAYAAAQENGNG